MHRKGSKWWQSLFQKKTLLWSGSPTQHPPTLCGKAWDETFNKVRRKNPKSQTNYWASKMWPVASSKKWPGQRKFWAGKIDELLLMLNDGNCKLDKVLPQDVHCRMFLYHLDLKLEQILSYKMFHCRTFLYDLSGNPGLQNSSGQSSLHLVCQVDNGLTNVDSMLSQSHAKPVWSIFFLVVELASAFSIPVVAGGTAEVSVSFGKESLQLDAPPQLARQVTLEALALEAKVCSRIWTVGCYRDGCSSVGEERPERRMVDINCRSTLNIIIPPRAM